VTEITVLALEADTPKAEDESMTLFSTRALTGALFAAAMLIASAMQAAPITMDANPVTINGLRGTFTISLTSGSTTNNQLNFSVTGSDPSGFLPAAGIAAIVFDGVSVVSAGELSDPHGLITGLSIPGTGTLAGVLLDFGAPSTATFFVRLSGTPTTASIYSLASATDMAKLSPTNTYNTSYSCKTDRRGHSYDCKPPKLPYKQKIGVRFSSDREEVPIPEPTAALCFAAGLTLVATRLRRP
jgi:hypothetical protein